MADDRLIEMTRELYEAFNRGDTETILAQTDLEIEIRDPDRTGQTYRGHEDYQRFIGDWMESWDSYAVEIAELTQNGDRVLADLVQSGRGKGSGIEFSEPFHQVLTFRDGKVVRFEIYIERADAERAARLRD